MWTLAADPLSKAAFEPYGDVIEASASAVQKAINYGHTTRFHDLAALKLTADGGRPGVSIFRSTPLAQPIKVEIMEYHPLSSQAFIPLSGNPYLVVVAPPGAFDANTMRAFVASPKQGVNYHAGTWHHFSLALGDVSDFLVVDRIADEDDAVNCIEHRLDANEQAFIELPGFK